MSIGWRQLFTVETTGQREFVSDKEFIVGSNTLQVYRNGVLQYKGPEEDYIEVDSKTIQFNTQSKKVTPNMTSNTTPTGTVSASSELDAHHEAHKAFNGVTSNPMHVWMTSDIETTPWIMYSFGVPTRIRTYTITCGDLSRPDIMTMPNGWILKGSNDETTWITLDTKTQQTFTINYERKEYELIQDYEFSHYKIEFSGTVIEALEVPIAFACIDVVSTPPIEEYSNVITRQDLITILENTLDDDWTTTDNVTLKIYNNRVHLFDIVPTIVNENDLRFYLPNTFVSGVYTVQVYKDDIDAFGAPVLDIDGNPVQLFLGMTDVYINANPVDVKLRVNPSVVIYNDNTSVKIIKPMRLNLWNSGDKILVKEQLANNTFGFVLDSLNGDIIVADEDLSFIVPTNKSSGIVSLAVFKDINGEYINIGNTSVSIIPDYGSLISIIPNPTTIDYDATSSTLVTLDLPTNSTAWNENTTIKIIDAFNPEIVIDTNITVTDTNLSFDFPINQALDTHTLVVYKVDKTVNIKPTIYAVGEIEFIDNNALKTGDKIYLTTDFDPNAYMSFDNKVPAAGTSETVIINEDGTTVVTLNNPYVPNVGAIEVFLNSVILWSGTDYIEQDSKTIKFLTTYYDSLTETNKPGLRRGDILYINAAYINRELQVVSGSFNGNLFKRYGDYQTLRENNRYTISAKIGSQTLSFTFTSKYSPLYSNIKDIRLDTHTLLHELDNDIFNLSIYQNSKLGLELYKSFNTDFDETTETIPGVLRRWVRYKSDLDLAYSKYLDIASNNGSQTKNIGPMQITKDIKLPYLDDMLKRLQKLFDEADSLIRTGSKTVTFSKAGTSNAYPLTARRSF